MLAKGNRRVDAFVHILLDVLEEELGDEEGGLVR